MSSIDDPLLKELLAALKEDTQLMAADLLGIITTNALIAVFALFLAFATLVRISSSLLGLDSGQVRGSSKQL